MKSPEAPTRLAAGALIAMVPVVNLLSMGYLVQYARKVRSGHLDLPRWVDPVSLLRDGLLFLAVALVWTGIPGILGWGVALVAHEFLDLLRLYHAPWIGALLYSAAWLPLMLAMAVAVPLTLLAVLRLADSGSLAQAFEFGEILHSLRNRLAMIAVPTLAAFGIAGVLWPLCGFAFFIASLLLLAYYALAFEG